MTSAIYQRWQRRAVEEALGIRRVVLLEGPRQSGKTTLSKTFVSGEAVYRTLDDPRSLGFALDDPVGFVRHGDGLMVIDEVQRAPDLLLAVKMDVDANQRYGRYLLTGSVHIQSLPTVRESLAGRIRKVRLRPLGEGEVLGGSPGFIRDAFDGAFRLPATRLPATRGTDPGVDARDRDAYIALAMRGGFPEVVGIEDARDARKWHEDYLAALVDRDLRDIANIGRKDGLVKLVEVLAAWSSKEADISKIGASPPISRPTIESYINALEALYVVERVRPWHSNDYSRITKRDKIFMTDSGFMSSVLKWTFEGVRTDGDLAGKLIETFVFNQLSAILEAQKDTHDLYHYRDRDGREVDLLVQNGNGDILGIEVKAGSVPQRSMLKHLDWFKRNLAAGRNFKGVVLYTGDQVVSYGDDMWAVPIRSLWA